VTRGRVGQPAHEEARITSVVEVTPMKRRSIHSVSRMAVSLLLTAAAVFGDAQSGFGQETPVTYPPFVQFALETCGGIDQPEGRVMLVGIVRDSVSMLRTPGATTTANWREGEGARAVNRAGSSVTNESGYFAFCDVPAGGQVTLRVSALGRQSQAVTVRLTEMLVQKQDLLIALTEVSTQGEGGLVGLLQDRESGEPVDGAEVSLADGAGWRVTNQTGRFIFEDLSPGLHTLQIEHLSYGSRSYQVDIPASGAAQIRISLNRDPIELDPIVVTAQSAAWVRTMSGFFERLDRGLGHFVTPEELDDRPPSTLADALQMVPGVRLMLRTDPEYRLQNRYMIVLQNAVRMSGAQGGPCAALVYIDGIQVGRRSGEYNASEWDPNNVSGADIAAIEIYRGASELPAEFSGSESGCGVVVVWTKR
jgi:hypothetical protein